MFWLPDGIRACPTSAHWAHKIAWESLARDCSWFAWAVTYWRAPTCGGRLFLEMDWSRRASLYYKCCSHQMLRQLFFKVWCASWFKNCSNLVSEEMEKYLEEIGIVHHCNTPLWPRANGGIERQNRWLLKAMRVSQAEGKDWQLELNKFLLAYQSTTYVSPAELFFNTEETNYQATRV